MSRANANTYVAGSGRLLTRIYAGPVNYRSHGRFVAINAGLVRRGGAYRQRGNDLGVRLPLSAGGSARLSTAGGGVSFALRGARGRRSVNGRLERFVPAGGGTALAFSSLNVGVGWQATTAAAQSGLSWRVRMTRGLHAVLVAHGVALRNARGRTVWMFAAPTARRAGHTLATRLAVRTVGRVAVIHVAVSASASAAGSFSGLARPEQGAAVPAVLPNPSPTVFDGQVVQGDLGSLGLEEQTGDCYLDSSSPDTSLCGASTNYVGPDDHTLENFDVSDALPQNVDVLDAWVSMTLSSQSSSTAEPVGVWEAGDPWTNAATWDTYDGSTPWTTAGGDTWGAMSDSQTIGASGEVGESFEWDITPIMQGWVDQDPARVDGLIFEATAGSSAPNTLGFQTETGASPAYIDVVYQAREGDYPNAKYDTQSLTNRSTLGVNVANENLMLSNTDLDLAGINGLGLQIGRYYNNLSDYQGAFGIGWTMSPGADTYLVYPCDGKEVDYFDGTGDGEPFGASGQSPPGLDDALSMNDAGDPYDSSSFSLLARHSGITLSFSATAHACGKVARLTSISDRNGNTISYHYTSGQLTSITDSYGNTTTIDWNTAGYVSEIIAADGRTYHYWQNNSGQLTRYEDPAGNNSYYTYDSSGNLTHVETPSTRAVNIAYNTDSGNQVASVERPVNPGDTTGPESQYTTAVAGSNCPGNSLPNPGWMQDSVQNPDGYTTIYCTDSMGRLTGVIDASGHDQSTTYNGDGYVSNYTDALNIPTSFSYSGDGDDNITQIQQGETGGVSGTGGYSSPLDVQYGYSGTAGTTNQYLPSSSTDASGNATSYAYGTGAAGSYGAGELASITDGLSTQNQARLSYNPNGTVASSTDPDGNQTTYAYTSGNLTTVTPPSGSGLNPITLTYDSANRVGSVSTIGGSPATEHKVIYSYNTLDQITCATYKNAAGTTVATINYTYDPDGNLTQISDPNGDTSYTYDGLGRLTSETFPNSDYVDYSYDPAGNLTTLTDPSGTTSYSYNHLNQLTSVKDPGASHPVATFTYNADGQPLATSYASGASVVNTYNQLGQLTQTNNTYKTSTGALAHLTYSYTYTPGGLQHTLTDPTGATTTYSYDPLNRLTGAVTGPTSSPTTDYHYTMDGDGNILTDTVSGSSVTGSTATYAYNPGNEICWSVSGASSNPCGTVPSGGHAYTYDADGNETSNGNGLSMTYNALDQMTSATAAGTTTNYSYLGEGQALLYGIGSSGQTLENSLLGVISQGDGGTSTTSYYTRAATGQLIDERTSAGTYNYLYDGNGNVIGLVDSSGHLVKQPAYDPYGNPTSTTGGVANSFGFKGGYTTSGLIHYGARYLNSAQSSWTQQDPVDQIGSLTQGDRYLYASDDPINLADPGGQATARQLCLTGLAIFIFACDVDAPLTPIEPLPVRTVTVIGEQIEDAAGDIFDGIEKAEENLPEIPDETIRAVASILP